VIILAIMTERSLSGTVTDASGTDYGMSGSYDSRFSRVAEAFADNFASGEEIGAAFALTVDGRVVADLWGGWKDAGRSDAWKPETLMCTMSVAKAFAVTCLHMLVERGLVDLDEPVSSYWPEFQAGGKEALPVRYLVDHRAGLPVVERSIDQVTIYDGQAMAAALASQTPLWEPGSRAGYHVLTLGYLVGELVRRVTGGTLGTFLRREVSGPLGLDFFVGLRADEVARCADYVPTLKGTLFDREIVQAETLSARAWAQMPEGEDFNSPAWRAAEIPGANGHGTARSIARFYAALVCNELEGVRLLSRSTFDQAIAEQWAETEIVLGRPYRMSLGYLLNNDFIQMGPNPRTFGHHGVGGSIGFGDPDARLGFAYATNKMHARLDNGPRAARLIEAVYASL
jgi:CubicO group peptidase (beta-lactamase class C family)